MSHHKNKQGLKNKRFLLRVKKLNYKIMGRGTFMPIENKIKFNRMQSVGGAGLSCTNLKYKATNPPKVKSTS